MKEIQDLSLRYFYIIQKVNIIEKKHEGRMLEPTKKCVFNKEGSVYCHMTKNG